MPVRVPVKGIHYIVLILRIIKIILSLTPVIIIVICRDMKILLTLCMFVVFFVYSSLKIENYIACPHPILDPFDPIMMKFVKKEPPLACNPEENWVTIKGNIARITDKALKKYGDIQCKFMGKINITRRFLVLCNFHFTPDFVLFQMF